MVMTLTDKSLTNPLRLLREASTINDGAAPTQEQVVEESGLSWPTIWRYEEGQVIPPPSTVRLLIKILQPGLAREELIDRADTLFKELVAWQAVNAPTFVNKTPHKWRSLKRKEEADNGG